MKNLPVFVSLIVSLVASAAFATESAVSPTEPTAKKTATKRVHQKKAPTAMDDDEKEPEVKGLQPIAFHCELGNTITIYNYPDNDQEIALRWNKRLHRMMRVSTTTGANRFENANKGLVWIGIPAKSILLDSKKGQQLANECKSSQQAASKVSAQGAALKG